MVTVSEKLVTNSGVLFLYPRLYSAESSACSCLLMHFHTSSFDETRWIATSLDEDRLALLATHTRRMTVSCKEP